MTRAKEWDDLRQSYVHASRRIMERHLGRRLRPDQLVHHINGDHTDDRLENLEVLSASEHRQRHLDMGTALVDNDDLFRTKTPLSTTLEHGTYGRYNKGCRCAACKKASSDRKRGSAAWKAKYRETVARLEAAEREDAS